MADTVAARLRDEGLDASAWTNVPGDRYGAHKHGYDKVIAVERGSIRFGLPDAGAAIALGAGDRLELPAGTRHDAVVGPDGVTCLEAHLPVGSLASVRRSAAGSWRPTERPGPPATRGSMSALRRGNR